MRSEQGESRNTLEPRGCRSRQDFRDSLESEILQQLLEFPVLVHLGHDVGTADEFTLDVKLRNGRPIGVVLDPLADLRILQHIHGKQLFHAQCLQDGHCFAGKTALRELRAALHVEHHRMRGDLLVDALLDVCAHGVSTSREWPVILSMRAEPRQGKSGHPRMPGGSSGTLVPYQKECRMPRDTTAGEA